MKVINKHNSHCITTCTLVKIVQMCEAALGSPFEVSNRCEKSHAVIRIDSSHSVQTVCLD